MNLIILAIGKKKSEYDSMIKEYQKRVVAPFSLSVELTDNLLSKVKPGDYVVALDEHGKDYTTVEFSKLIEKQLHNSTKRVVFLIGDAYGLNTATKDRADLVLRLGSFTLPHELARLIIAEQLYRVTNFLGGGKYHHQ